MRTYKTITKISSIKNNCLGPRKAVKGVPGIFSSRIKSSSSNSRNSTNNIATRCISFIPTQLGPTPNNVENDATTKISNDDFLKTETSKEKVSGDTSCLLPERLKKKLYEKDSSIPEHALKKIHLRFNYRLEYITYMYTTVYNSIQPKITKIEELEEEIKWFKDYYRDYCLDPNNCLVLKRIKYIEEVITKELLHNYSKIATIGDNIKSMGTFSNLVEKCEKGDLNGNELKLLEKNFKYVHEDYKKFKEKIDLDIKKREQKFKELVCILENIERIETLQEEIYNLEKEGENILKDFEFFANKKKEYNNLTTDLIKHETKPTNDENEKIFNEKEFNFNDKKCELESIIQELSEKITDVENLVFFDIDFDSKFNEIKRVCDNLNNKLKGLKSLAENIGFDEMQKKMG